MTPLGLSVNDNTILSVTLESSIMILDASFDDNNMFIAEATNHYSTFELTSIILCAMAP
jgi:hypothetical protein